ncbi:signal recognition particle protein [Reyranella sp. MMS21-HV4-11]|jgi:signal recognition particle subunit SRP54|uniref:Signal recognition particle protein n=1 Tax=Reyranella humidisoli TaxID=2849149 RepID=A0ABS6IIC3_9HYPH|nr:signal recognition particle protein [Reyranella sp. MMS21-HV4-11]MBU8873634.1 signal recognition particle protein [Reyranella sp. MMS21-HV4-11]
MFEGLSKRLGDVFDKLRGRGALSEADVDAALREVRTALLEADVALSVVRQFIDEVRPKAIGADVIRSVTPGQMVIKIVNDHLVEMLGGTVADLDLGAIPPVVILMVGLQGSGKTTSSAKIAYRLSQGPQGMAAEMFGGSFSTRRKVMMASLDTRRPAAQHQLKVLGEQTNVPTLPIVPLEMPLAITRRALETAKREGFDVLILDTAGRLSIDEELMKEVADISDLAKPKETLLVADAMTGQDAVNVAKAFNDRLAVTGIVLTRVDGDARGGAALSMRAVTGRPVKLIGVGEKFDALEPFHPDRIASRILGMGDIVSLVERAAETIDKEDAEKLAAKVRKGQFDMDDLLNQLRQLRKMGGLSGLMGMLPGAMQAKAAMSKAKIDEGQLKRQEAVILAMTPKERRNPDMIHASRKKRIAKGSGVQVQDVNKLLKQHADMLKMMKRVNKLGEKGFMRSLGGGMGMPPGFPR